ncbi:unnamed protein product [Cuscuta europaea]|uniref:Uncharacterized protein n=1 Tax=Cuscuta europaea TaxID=41803 RepID=A0A9P1E9T7_CUSEU|nr:unnamed protein product [Cuscuta europaea]
MAQTLEALRRMGCPPATEYRDERSQTLLRRIIYPPRIFRCGILTENLPVTGASSRKMTVRCGGVRRSLDLVVAAWLLAQDCRSRDRRVKSLKTVLLDAKIKKVIGPWLIAAGCEN